MSYCYPEIHKTRFENSQTHARTTITTITAVTVAIVVVVIAVVAIAAIATTDNHENVRVIVSQRFISHWFNLYLFSFSYTTSYRIVHTIYMYVRMFSFVRK